MYQSIVEQMRVQSLCPIPQGTKAAITETLNKTVQQIILETSMTRAVVVDSEKANRGALRQKLHNLYGDNIFIVAEAFSVVSAIDSIITTAPDIVFLDIEIIGGTGFDILDVFPDRTFAVIFVTSYSTFGQEAFRYKALDYILKPIDPEKLREAVKRFFILNIQDSI